MMVGSDKINQNPPKKNVIINHHVTVIHIVSKQCVVHIHK